MREERTTIEILEYINQVQRANEEMAAALKEIQGEMQRMKQDMTPLHDAAKDVSETATACDDIIEAIQKTKDTLRASVNKRFGGLHPPASEIGTYTAVQDAYTECMTDFENAIKNISFIKDQMKEDTVSTASQVKNAFQTMGAAAANKVKELLQALSIRAKLHHAKALEKQADAHRKSENRLRNVRKAILRMDKGICEHKHRFKNAMHALKGESFEEFNYEAKGLTKKLTDILMNDAKNEQEKHLYLQDKADKIRSSCGVPESYDEDEEQAEVDVQAEEEAEDMANTMGM